MRKSRINTGVSENNEEVIVGIVQARKEQGPKDIAYNLRDRETGIWENQKINFNQFKKEVIEKGTKYIEEIVATNTENILIDKIKQEFASIM